MYKMSNINFSFDSQFSTSCWSVVPGVFSVFAHIISHRSTEICIILKIKGRQSNLRDVNADLLKVLSSEN